MVVSDVGAGVEVTIDAIFSGDKIVIISCVVSIGAAIAAWAVNAIVGAGVVTGTELSEQL